MTEPPAFLFSGFYCEQSTLSSTLDGSQIFLQIFHFLVYKLLLSILISEGQFSSTRKPDLGRSQEHPI